MCRTVKVVSQSLLAYVHYCAADLLGRRDQADAFIDVFRTGIPSRSGCPAHAAREVIIKNRGTGTTIRREAVQRVVTKAWNLFAKGEDFPDRMYLPRVAVEFDGLKRSAVWVPAGVKQQIDE